MPTDSPALRLMHFFAYKRRKTCLKHSIDVEIAPHKLFEHSAISAQIHCSNFRAGVVRQVSGIKGWVAAIVGMHQLVRHDIADLAIA